MYVKEILILKEHFKILKLLKFSQRFLFDAFI